MESKTLTIYKFNCQRCGKKSESVFKDKAEEGKCRPCRTSKVIWEYSSMTMIKKLLLFLFTFFYFLMPIKAMAKTFIWPVANPSISTYFSAWHPGIDLAVPCYTPVVSSKWGTITYAGWDDTGYGNRVDTDDGIDFVRYAHLVEIDVSLGQWVNQGDRIGLVGMTGNATGCHLHFETHWYGWGLPPYGGAVDPLVPLQ